MTSERDACRDADAVCPTVPAQCKVGRAACATARDACDLYTQGCISQRRKDQGVWPALAWYISGYERVQVRRNVTTAENVSLPVKSTGANISFGPNATTGTGKAALRNVTVLRNVTSVVIDT